MKSNIKVGQHWRRVRYPRPNSENILEIVMNVSAYPEIWGVRHSDGSLGELSAWFIQGDYVLVGGPEDELDRSNRKLPQELRRTVELKKHKKVSMPLETWLEVLALLPEPNHDAS